MKAFWAGPKAPPKVWQKLLKPIPEGPPKDGQRWIVVCPSAQIDSWPVTLRRHPSVRLLAVGPFHPKAWLSLSASTDATALRQILRRAAESLNPADLGLSRNQNRTLQTVLRIGIRLGAEHDMSRLLEIILRESILLADADSGSIALLGLDENFRRTSREILTFYLSQNRSMSLDYVRSTMRVNDHSLSGFAVLRKQVLNIPDAYALPSTRPYRFNADFDKASGFHTKSMLIVPMINHLGEVMGVISLLNKRRHPDRKIRYRPFDPESVIAFGDDDIQRLEALGGQATVALENALLTRDIEALFEGFVTAAVKSIESRDPSTAGHSFRVTQYTMALARAYNESADPPFAGKRFTPDQMRELRYACLLHDFGKIAVHERVLLKAKKMDPADYAAVMGRFELYDAQLLLTAERRKVEALRSGREDLIAAIESQLGKDRSQLQVMKAAVEMANEPSVLEHNTASLIQDLRGHVFQTPDGRSLELINQAEAELLSIPRGSLSPVERKEIESHVTHSHRFLQLIPWTRELAEVPNIAWGHHELLDGSGYPQGLKANALSVQTRMMTICDIFDALTAADRSYKKALPLDVALRILNDEVQRGRLDADLFRLFIDHKVHQAAEIGVL